MAAPISVLPQELSMLIQALIVLFIPQTSFLIVQLLPDVFFLFIFSVDESNNLINVIREHLGSELSPKITK